MRQPLIIIDGVTSNHGTLGLEPNDIRSINVRKDEGTIKLYGGQGSDGVIIITTKNKTTQSDNFKVSFLNENLNTRTSKNYLYTPKSINLRSNIMRQPLIIIDGVISNHGTLGLVPNNIKSISVRKDERTIKLYGGQGNDGVILITTKNKTVL